MLRKIARWYIIYAVIAMVISIFVSSVVKSSEVAFYARGLSVSIAVSLILVILVLEVTR